MLLVVGFLAISWKLKLYDLNMKIEIKINDTLENLDSKYICEIVYKDKYVAFFLKEEDSEPQKVAYMIQEGVNGLLK